MEKDELFSVYQFFNDGSNECVRKFAPMEECLTAFRHYSSSVGAKMGLTVRVIITDGGDSTCAEWVRGVGITFPTMESMGIY